MTAEYHCPTELSQAVVLLAEKPYVVLAGGTDLYPATKAQRLEGAVLDLGGIKGLRGIERDDHGWRIGAATTWTDVSRAELPPAFDGLKRAAQGVGAAQIQNAGTVAGNLCNASPAADGVPPLLTLDATVETVSTRGTRYLPLADFILGPRRTALEQGEMVSTIRIPAAAGEGISDFRKLGARKHLVISIAMVAGRFVVENGKLETARIAVGSCSAVARRLTALEEALTGMPEMPSADFVTENMAMSLDPIDDIRGSSAYRLQAASEMIVRMLGRVLR